MNNNEDGIYIEQNDNGYYRPTNNKKSFDGVILLLVIIAAIISGFLWFSGVLTPVDKENQYVKLINNICDMSVKYAENETYRSKIDNIDIPGKIVYIKLSDLIEANLIGVNIIDPRTNTIISPNTDIRLGVKTSTTVICDGLAFAIDDRVKPTISLNGDKTMYLGIGETFVDPGVMAIDDKDGDISDKVHPSGTLNKNKAGTYILTYRAQDRAGNISDPITRTIIVR